MADELDKLLRKANAENEKSRKPRRPAPAPKGPAMPPPTPENDERYVVYRVLCPARISFVEFVLFISAILCLFMMWVIGSDQPMWVWNGHDMFLLSTFAVIGLLLLRFVFTELYMFLTFPAFRKWRKNLPYTLEGWPEMVDMPHFGKIKWWRSECRITVRFGRPDQHAVEAFNALARSLCTRLNKTFYTPFSSDSRTTWSLNEFELKGSMNGNCARKIYRFLHNDMALLAARYGQPEKIVITVRGGVEEVTPESSD